MSLEKLKSDISKFDNLIVAFSGGVDSSLLAKVAHDTLKDKFLAITIKTEYMSDNEIKFTTEFAKFHNFRHEILEISTPKEIENSPKNRCYLCKFRLFSEILKFAKNIGFTNIADGTNKDDLGEYRPGIKAAKELGILSPLSILSKKEIREISKDLGLTTHDKPSFPCLLTRFPYGYKFSSDDLNMIENIENLLSEYGFLNFRARFDGKAIKLEMSYQDMIKLSQNFKILTKEIYDIFKGEILLDMKGLRGEILND